MFSGLWKVLEGWKSYLIAIAGGLTAVIARMNGEIDDAGLIIALFAVAEALALAAKGNRAIKAANGQ